MFLSNQFSFFTFSIHSSTYLLTLLISLIYLLTLSLWHLLLYLLLLAIIPIFHAHFIHDRFVLSLSHWRLCLLCHLLDLVKNWVILFCPLFLMLTFLQVIAFCHYLELFHFFNIHFQYQISQLIHYEVDSSILHIFLDKLSNFH